MKFNEARKLAEAIKQFNAIIPVMVNDMGQIALNTANQSFRDQGFTDEAKEPWQPRKRSDRGRAILIKTGRGRRSIRKQKRGKYRVDILSVGYMKVHNEGLRSGRGRGFKMPKRQYIGNSATMNRKIKEKLQQRIRSIFRK